MKDIVPNTILLVEDEVLLAMDEQMTLENYGYKVTITGTGEEAVKIVDTNPDINLILMDINLGAGIEGTEAAKQILAKHDLPLIFLLLIPNEKLWKKQKGLLLTDTSLKIQVKLSLLPPSKWLSVFSKQK